MSNNSSKYFLIGCACVTTGNSWSWADAGALYCTALTSKTFVAGAYSAKERLVVLSEGQPSFV